MRRKYNNVLVRSTLHYFLVRLRRLVYLAPVKASMLVGQISQGKTAVVARHRFVRRSVHLLSVRCHML
jgi:hypothetical protein